MPEVLTSSSKLRSNADKVNRPYVVYFNTTTKTVEITVNTGNHSGQVLFADTVETAFIKAEELHASLTEENVK